jgi:hypothetical protein
MNIDHPEFDNPAIGRFAVLAEQFCTAVEQRVQYDLDSFLQRVHDLLPRLYVHGLELPHTNVLFSDSGQVEEELDAAHQIPEYVPDPDAGDIEEWRTLFHALTDELGTHCNYREVFDPYSEDEEEVTGSLADDLADIYRELRSGLRKWKRGQTGAALWDWRFGFESHWGEHATGALRALRSLSAWHDLPWPPATSGEPVVDGLLPRKQD